MSLSQLPRSREAIPEKEELPFSPRSFASCTTASSWEDLWEAGSYYERMAELLEDAHQYAVFVGWQVDSRLPFHRPPRPGHPRHLETLKEKVIRLCEEKPDFHIYFLMWDHAYFYCLERETMQYRVWDEIHPRVHFVFDNRHPFGASHHEKLAIIDGKIALCGGIDLCDERWDSPQHLYFDPRRSLNWRKEHHGPYHDLAVQVTGPVVPEIHRHVAYRWRQISTIPFPEPEHGLTRQVHGGHRVYVSRTIASIDAGERDLPIIREVEFMTRELVQKAERRIILEGQYYWSESFNELLIAKMHQMKGRAFEIVLVLADLHRLKSLTRNMAYHELELIDRLQKAARETGTRLIAGYPVAHPPEDADSQECPRKSVYVHSKTTLIDDRFLCIGSANLASRAFRVDTELNLTFEARSDAERAYLRRMAQQILGHWNLLPSPHRDVTLEPFQPRTEMARLRREHPVLTRIPWKLFFDPKIPWLYPLKVRFRSWERTQLQAILGLILGLWLMGAATAALLAGLSASFAFAPASWTFAYALVLTSVWLLPTPFTAIAGLASLHLGPDAAAPLAVSSFWVAALWGYVLTRMFPTFSARFYRRTKTDWLPQRLGLRSFPYLISVLADPRVSIRSKIVYQGLYCVPTPWFVLGTMLVMPGAIALFCRAIGMSAEWLPEIRGGAAQGAPWILGLTAIVALGDALWRFNSTRRSENEK